MKKILENKLSYLIITILIYIAMCHYINISYFTIISIGFMILIYLGVKNYFLSNLEKSNIIIAILFTICFSFGRICFNNMHNNSVNILLELISLKNLFYNIGLFLFIYLIISIIIKKLTTLKVIESKNINSKKIFLKSLIIILICWTPYFLSSYPGYVAPDSVYQIQQATKMVPLTDHHPVFHTMFIKVFYNIGSLFSTSQNFRVACITIAQMLIMALIYSYFITFLSKKKIKKSILLGLTIMFGLLPVFAYYSLMMWKDVLFGGFFLLFLIILCNMIEQKNNIKYSNLIAFSVVSLLILFLRNNALYMYFILIPFFIFYFSKQKLKIFMTFIIVLICFFTVKYPLYNTLNIERSKSWEYLGIPIQQIGRMAYKDTKFTKQEKRRIEKFMKVKDLKEEYNPILSDDIKFSLKMNQTYFDKNSKEFIILWKDLIIKHFDTAVESYLISTLGYWYPDLMNNAVENKVTVNELDIHSHPLLPKPISNFFNDLYHYDTPILCLQWNIGLILWFILLLAVICFKKNKKYLLCYLPICGMWLTLMVASPVNGMLRYVFWAYTSLPLLFFINYFKSSSK